MADRVTGAKYRLWGRLIMERQSWTNHVELIVLHVLSAWSVQHTCAGRSDVWCVVLHDCVNEASILVTPKPWI